MTVLVQKLLFPGFLKAWSGGDKNIVRICLASSVEKFIQAIETDSRVLKTGTEFTVYEAEPSPASRKLTRPDELNLRELVTGSMENMLEDENIQLGRSHCGY